MQHAINSRDLQDPPRGTVVTTTKVLDVLGGQLAVLRQAVSMTAHYATYTLPDKLEAAVPRLDEALFRRKVTGSGQLLLDLTRLNTDGWATAEQDLTVHQLVRHLHSVRSLPRPVRDLPSPQGPTQTTGGFNRVLGHGVLG